MRKTLRGKYVVVSTKMRSKSVYSEGAHWEEQGLNPGLNFSLCLKEKASLFSFFLFFFFLFFFFFFSLFFFLFPFFFSVVQPRLAPDQTCRLVPIGMFNGGPNWAKKKKQGKRQEKRLVMAVGQYLLVRSTLGKTKFRVFKACHDGMT